jgi:hypothetical protein
VFLFAGTTARTSDALLGWNCGYTFTSNVMYGVLYAVSPELFPTKDRGTGNAIVATANRVFGIMVRPSLTPRVRGAVAAADGVVGVGTDHCAVRESGDVGADLRRRSAVLGGGVHSIAPPLRAEREGLDLILIASPCGNTHIRLLLFVLCIQRCTCQWWGIHHSSTTMFPPKVVYITRCWWVLNTAAYLTVTYFTCKLENHRRMIICMRGCVCHKT